MEVGNCTFENDGINAQPCSGNLNTEQANRTDNLSRSLDDERMIKRVDDNFESSMEMIFEVSLLTIFGIAGIIGNLAAIILFARYVKEPFCT